jgi:hypothetical protein
MAAAHGVTGAVLKERYAAPKLMNFKSKNISFVSRRTQNL